MTAAETFDDPPVRGWRLLTRFAAAHLARHGESLLFDFGLYGVATVYFADCHGPVLGALAVFAAMTPLSALACAIYIRLYDWSARDWLGLEALKALRDGSADIRLERGLARVLKFGDAPAFLALSIVGDPFLTTIYLRRASPSEAGPARRDWAILLSSAVIGNAYWSLRWSAAVVVVRYFLSGMGIA